MKERRARDKNKTLEDILTTARSLFSQKGLHGTSIRDIENESGVSKGLILHHFGTKEKLYEAVQEQLTEEYIGMLADQRPSSGDFRELVATTIRNSFRHIQRNREYRRISLWSYLEDQENNSDLEQRFTLALISTMRLGQESGRVRDDIDPFLMPFIIRGTIEYWIRKEKLIKTMTAGDEFPGADAEERLIDALTVLFVER